LYVHVEAQRCAALSDSELRHEMSS
jgi:hypothetical protein